MSPEYPATSELHGTLVVLPLNMSASGLTLARPHPSLLYTQPDSASHAWT